MWLEAGSELWLDTSLISREEYLHAGFYHRCRSGGAVLSLHPASGLYTLFVSGILGRGWRADTDRLGGEVPPDYTRPWRDIYP